MADLVQIPFSISSGSSYSKRNNDSELLNLFVHIEEQGSKSNHILLNTPGLLLIAEAEYTIYGVYEFLGITYIATGKALFRLDREANIFINIGAVSFDKQVVFADNGISMMMVGGNGFAYTPETGLIKDMSFDDGYYPADTVAYMDGYFIFNRTGTGQFFISGLYSIDVNPIDWATGEAAPDDTVGVIVSNRQLWIIGERSTEVWYDSGNADFPFTRVPGAVTDIGCSDYRTIDKVRDSVFFVGNDFKVYQTKGYTPTVVSTSAIDYHLARAENKSFSAFTYTLEGHWFYVLTIDETLTFVYDINTAQWHKQKSCDAERWMIDTYMIFQ